MARRADITLQDDFFTNETRSLEFTIDDESDPDPALSLPVNITGQSLSFEFRLGEKGPVQFTLTTTGGGITIVNGPAGRADVAITAALTINLKPSKKYFYVLKRDDAGSELVYSFGEVLLRKG